MASFMCPPVAESRAVPFFSESAAPATNAGGPATRVLPALPRLLLSALLLCATCLPPSPILAGGVTGLSAAQSHYQRDATVASGAEHRPATVCEADYRLTFTEVEPTTTTDVHPTTPDDLPTFPDHAPTTSDPHMLPPTSLAWLSECAGCSISVFFVPKSSIASLSDVARKLENPTPTYLLKKNQDAGETFMRGNRVATTVTNGTRCGKPASKRWPVYRVPSTKCKDVFTYFVSQSAQLQTAPLTLVMLKFVACHPEDDYQDDDYVPNQTDDDFVDVDYDGDDD